MIQAILLLLLTCVAGTVVQVLFSVSHYFEAKAEQQKAETRDLQRNSPWTRADWKRSA